MGRCRTLALNAGGGEERAVGEGGEGGAAVRGGEGDWPGGEGAEGGGGDVQSGCFHHVGYGGAACQQAAGEMDQVVTQPCTRHPAPTRHLTLFILHPGPYTLHPRPYTLHPTPHTPHPTPHTNPTPYTWHPSTHTLHPIPCTLPPSRTLNSKPMEQVVVSGEVGEGAVSKVVDLAVSIKT